jgi:hypothetical protein
VCPVPFEALDDGPQQAKYEAATTGVVDGVVGLDRDGAAV